jgi:hypothetical protein
MDESSRVKGPCRFFPLCQRSGSANPLSNQLPMPQKVVRLLEDCLGDEYLASEWKEPLDAVLNAESSVEAALQALEELQHKYGIDTSSQSPNTVITDQCTNLQNELLELVDDLKKRRRIIGEPRSLEEIVDPIEERKVGESFNEDQDAEIILTVQNEQKMENVMSTAPTTTRNP